MTFVYLYNYNQSPDLKNTRYLSLYTNFYDFAWCVKHYCVSYPSPSTHAHTLISSLLISRLASIACLGKIAESTWYLKDHFPKEIKTKFRAHLNPYRTYRLPSTAACSSTWATWRPSREVTTTVSSFTTST